MTKSELNKYENVLQAKQAELVRLVRNRDGIAIEKSPDAFDEVQHAAERELAIRNLDRESNLLRNVRAALRRIEEDARRAHGHHGLQGLTIDAWRGYPIASGSFGVCLRCEEDISPKRLAAVPWTPFCIQCQEIADRNQDASADNFEEWLINAA